MFGHHNYSLNVDTVLYGSRPMLRYTGTLCWDVTVKYSTGPRASVTYGVIL